MSFNSQDEPLSLPERMTDVGATRAQFGDLAERLAPFLGRSDALADAVIEELWHLPLHEQQAAVDEALSLPGKSRGALGQLLNTAAAVPVWLDWERVDRAGKLFFRAGVLGGIVLGLRSLVYGYAAPAGNKPLALSGALTSRSERRLAETGRFVFSVCTPQAMHPGGEGFNTTLKVRLMHARVRALCLKDPRWDSARFGVPINQHDMMATLLLFSSVYVQGVRQLGVLVSPGEADDYQHLFRWVGQVIGVEPELLMANFDEAERMARFVRMTQGAADDDSRALVEALLTGPLRQARSKEEEKWARRHVSLARALCRSLIDEELADQLGLPRDGLALVAPGVRATVSLLEALRLHVSGLDDFVEQLGQRYWNFNVEQGLAGKPARFYLPHSLGSRRARESG